MTYRRLKADMIFDGEKWQEGKLLIVDPVGTVVDVIADDGNESENHAGILCPGFINAHCHLELSHMKGLVPEGEGMVQFLIDIVTTRKKDHPGKMESIEKAAEEMWEGGISGVGDICNTADSILVKKQSPASWYNLVEVINFYDSSLERQMGGFENVCAEFENAGMNAVLSPHAPYSISAATYQYINERTAGKIISIHNQESQAENDLFLSGKSDFLRLYAAFADGLSPFPVTATTSLRHWLPFFTNGQTILLVHNTYISESDILFANEHAQKYGLRLVYCICPNANLYIEKTLPPLDLLMKYNCHLVLGTDSYSSNYQLSIAEEIKTIREYFPGIALQTLLQWATTNGAEAFRWTDLGRFQKKKKPGVLLLDEFTFSVTRLF